MRNKTNGFLIIELLSTITIICALTAISVVAVSITKANAAAAHCKGHLKQLDIALTSYIQENNGRFPIWGIDSPRFLQVLSNDPTLLKCRADVRKSELSPLVSYDLNEYWQGIALSYIPSQVMRGNALIFDRSSWHRNRRIGVFSDGHVDSF